MGGGSDQSIIVWQYALNASWVLLPLVPAIVIYLMFPDTKTTFGGPFSGLSIKSSGAFSAYFIVLLATFPLLNMQNQNINTLLRPSWVITGKILVQDEQGIEIPYSQSVASPLKITLAPPIVVPLGQREFQVTVPEIEGKIPRIELEYPGYSTQSVNLANIAPGLNVETDLYKHEMTITSPIVFRRTQPCIDTKPNCGL